MVKAFFALLMLVMAAGSAFAVDLNPVATITASPNPAESVSVITVVGVDSGDKAGINSIQIFENGALIDTLMCAGATSCTFPKIVSHSTPGTRSYFGRVTDITGHSTNSPTITVSFDGNNVAPVLAPIGNKATTAGTLLTFTVTATDANPNDAITLTTTGLPAGATFTGGTFSWTPSITQIGNFSVTFFATDNHGASDNETINIEVTFVDSVPPGFIGGPGAGWSGDLTGTTGDPLLIFANATDNVDVTSGSITFSGGFSGTFAMAEGPANFFTFTLAVPCCSLAPIFYTITISDAAGNTNTTPSSTITVIDNDAPTAVIAGGNLTGFVGIPITFNGSASTDNIGIVSYFWDFGDSTTASGAIVTKTYTASGAFTVTLNVTDAAGNSAVTSLATITATIIFDTLAPEVTGLSFTNPLILGNSQVITVTITDNSGMLGSPVVELNAATNFTMTSAGSVFTATIPAVLLPLGNYNFTIFAPDFVGNINNSVTGSFDVVPASAPPPSGGSGGGGGGGRGGGGRTLDRNTVNFCWASLGLGAYSAVVPSWSEVPITKISFTSVQKLKDVCIKIELVNTSLLPSIEKPYKAVNITSNIPAEAITNIEFEYKVARNWTKLNSLLPENIALARLSGSWSGLESKLVKFDADYTYHVSPTPGLSIFIVHGKKPVQPGPEPKPEPQPEPEPEPEPEIVIPPAEGKNMWLAVLIIWLAVTALLVWGWVENLVPKKWAQGVLEDTPPEYGEFSRRLRRVFEQV